MIMMSLSLSSGMEPRFKLRGARSSLIKDLKKIGISILEVDKVVLLALIY